MVLTTIFVIRHGVIPPPHPKSVPPLPLPPQTAARSWLPSLVPIQLVRRLAHRRDNLYSSLSDQYPLRPCTHCPRRQASKRARTASRCPRAKSKANLHEPLLSLHTDGAAIGYPFARRAVDMRPRTRVCSSCESRRLDLTAI